MTVTWESTFQLVDEVVKLSGETEKDRLIMQQPFFEEKLYVMRNPASFNMVILGKSGTRSC